MAITYTAPPANPLPISQNTHAVIQDFDTWTRRRLSKNFIMRDFLFSSRSEILEKANRPSDDPDMVIKAGKLLCTDILEPLLEQFGRFAITYGYQSRDMIEAGYPKAKQHSSAPHHWDRGTFGTDVYARVDILPFCVEDGEVSKHEYGHWMMHNLNVDLLMQWQKSNVFCITISPKPRRVWLEWTKQGQGANGGNMIPLMMEEYWKYKWPQLPEQDRPKFGPSQSGGSLSW